MTPEEERLAELLGRLGDRHAVVGTDGAWLGPRLRRARLRRSAFAAAAAALAVTAVAGGVAATAHSRRADPLPPSSSPTATPASPATSPAPAAPTFVSAIGVRPDGTGAAVVGPCQLPGGTCQPGLRRTANAGKTIDSLGYSDLPAGPHAPEPTRVTAASRFALYVWGPLRSEIGWSATNGYNSDWKLASLDGAISDVEAAPDSDRVWIATLSCPNRPVASGCPLALVSGRAGDDPRTFGALGSPVASAAGRVAVSRQAGGSAAVGVGQPAAAGDDDAVFTTQDDGRTWARTALPCGQGTGRLSMVDVSLAPDGALWALCAGESTAGVQPKRAYVSEQPGSGFRDAGAPPASGYATSIAAASRASAWVSGDRGAVIGTSDAGRTWTAVTDSSDFFGPVQVLPDGTALAPGQADGTGAVWTGTGTARWTAHPVRSPGPFAGFSDCNALRVGEPLDWGHLTCDPDQTHVETVDCSTGVYVHLVRPGHGDLEGITGVSPAWRAAPPADPMYGRTPFAFNNCWEEEAGAGAFEDPGPAGFDTQCSDARVRPTYVVLTCADAGSVAQNLFWTDWKNGKAKGELVENDCKPTCLGGTKRSYEATFRFYAARDGRFTKVDIVFVSEGPNGQKTRTQDL
jgi:hypothetical protein